MNQFVKQNNIPELSPFSDYTDRTSAPIGAEWEQNGINPNLILIEMKLKEIKDILVLCSYQQQANFVTRIAEWIWFNNDAAEM